MYDKKENNFKKKGLCVSLCAALVCGLGIGGVYYKMNKAPQSDGTKLFSDSSTGTKSADTNDKKETSSDKKDNAADKNTENKTEVSLIEYKSVNLYIICIMLFKRKILKVQEKN